MKRVIITIAMLVTMTQIGVMASTKRALVIGIGAYPKESGWSAIHGDNDIPVVVEMLKMNGYEGSEIYSLKNEKATKANIKAAIKRLAEHSKPGDQVYIHFSGHGQQVVDVHNDEEDGMDEAWIPYDAQAKYVKGKYEGQNHILDDELYNWFSAIADKIGENGHLTISVDACHSGDGSRGEDDDTICVRGAFSDGTRGLGTVFATVRNWLTGEDEIKPSEERQVRWTMISACKPEQTNREYEGRGSLTAALRDIAGDLGNMTAEQVRVKVRNWMKSRFGDHQLPVVNPERKNNSFL